MSVSASKHSSTPSLESTTQAPGGAQAVTSAKAQVTTGPNFGQPASQSGPQFHCAPPCTMPGHLNPGPPPRPLPVHLNPGPPPRPNPSLPDPVYSKQSNEVLAQQLLDNYGAFKGRWPSRTVTKQSLQNLANKPLTGNPDLDANIKLARELLRRPGLMQALDREGQTGAVDNRLSKNDIKDFISSSNPLKLKDDKQLAQDLLNHFHQLSSPWSQSIKLSTLQQYASRPLCGHPATDKLIQLSKEIMARSNLAGNMDNANWYQRDGRITLKELRKLLA